MNGPSHPVNHRPHSQHLALQPLPTVECPTTPHTCHSAPHTQPSTHTRGKHTHLAPSSGGGDGRDAVGAVLGVLGGRPGGRRGDAVVAAMAVGAAERVRRHRRVRYLPVQGRRAAGLLGQGDVALPERRGQLDEQLALGGGDRLWWGEGGGGEGGESRRMRVGGVSAGVEERDSL